MPQEKIKPTIVLREMRESVSKILDRPYTERIDHQIFKPDQKILTLWALDCAEHVLPFFEEKFPKDIRPRKAIEILLQWINTGVFKMSVIRKASLDAHAAAHEANNIGENAAYHSAHAAGQAVATAHVVTHAFGCSVYGIRAAAAHSGKIEDGIIKERDWQLKRLQYYKAKN